MSRTHQQLSLQRTAGRQNVLLKLFSFSNYSTSSILLTVFPVYFASLGFSKTEIGLIFSIGPSMGILSNLIWGIASDRYQTIKKVLVVVLLGELAAAMLMFQFNRFAIVFPLMAAFYFFQTPITSLNDSQILLATRNSGKSYASFRVFGSLGFALSSVVFGFFLSKEDMSRTALLCVVTISITLLIALCTRDARGSSKKMDLSGIRGVFLSRPFLVFLALVLFLAVAAKINDSFLSLYMVELGASQTIIGFSWMISAVSEIPMFLLLARYGHKFKELPLLAFASVAFALRFLLLALPISPYAVLAIQTMHSVSYGIFLVTAMRYLQDLIPDRFRATGQAVFTMTWSGLAGLLSGSIGGAVFDNHGPHALYSLAAACAAIAACGFTLSSLRTRR